MDIIAKFIIFIVAVYVTGVLNNAKLAIYTM